MKKLLAFLSFWASAMDAQVIQQTDFVFDTLTLDWQHLDLDALDLNTLGLDSVLMGVISGGGRGAASAVHLQFASFGSGSDQNGIAAVERYLNYAMQYGNITAAYKRKWGKEGELNYCLEFADAAARVNGTKSLSRILWVGVDNGYPNTMKVSNTCQGSDALSVFSGSDLGSLVQFGKGPTLSCVGNGEKGYQVDLQVTEKIVTLNEIAVNLVVNQHSDFARYSPIVTSADKFAVNLENPRSFAISYEGRDLKLEIWPEIIPGTTDFWGRLSYVVASGVGEFPLLKCKSVN